MGAEVVDASALASLLFGEPDAGRVAEVLEGAELHAPSLIRYELASVALKKVRTYSTQAQSIEAALDLYGRLDVVETQVPGGELVRMARMAEITAYDAVYLWLARHVGAPVLTLDRKLASAAERIGIPLSV